MLTEDDEKRMWYKVTFTPEQVQARAPEQLVADIRQSHEANPEMIDVSIFEIAPPLEDGSRVCFFTPNAMAYFKNDIEPYHWNLSEAPKRSEVKNLFVFIDSFWYGELT